MQLVWSHLMSAGTQSIDTQHQSPVNMVNDIENAIMARAAAALLHAFKLFKAGGPMHIGEDNMRMKGILETYPYDFKPPESAA